MDDFRKPRQSGTPTYGRTPSPNYQQQPQQAPVQSAQQPVYDYQQYAIHPEQKNSSKKKSKKRIFWNTFLIALFIALVGIIGYLYLQVEELKKDNADLKADTLRLTQKVYSLDYDNRDLNKKLELQQTSYDELYSTAEQLKSTCGNACSDIELP